MLSRTYSVLLRVDVMSPISHTIKDFPGLTCFHFKIEEMKTSYLAVKQFEASFFLGNKKERNSLHGP